MVQSVNFTTPQSLHCGPGMWYLNCKISFPTMAYIKVAYFYLIFYATPRAMYRCRNPLSMFYAKNCSRATRLVTNLILGLFVLNFLLIGIVNPSLLNPGPSNLKIYYQNVQGLIPFYELDKQQPKLDETKVYEINSYINQNKPHVIMFNETWLKKSVGDREVIEDPVYKVYRLDRSKVSHPPDPDNPNKYRKYGGGVLIAFRTDIKDIEYKRLTARKGAELVAFELTLNGKKFVFCTVYRVNNLGKINHESIMNTIKTYYKDRNPRKIFIVGDFNLSGVAWPISANQDISRGIEKLFVDSFEDRGLDQCLTVPTHIKGRTLDILLTNSQSLISSLHVLEKDSICKSDHFPITFEIKTNFKTKPIPKRKIYNFKKANWEGLVKSLEEVEWDRCLNNREPEYAWKNFKIIFFHLVDTYIPTITIKSTFSSPWFDSECYEAYRAKKRSHRSRAESINNEIKFRSKRRSFKNLCNKKMRDNLYNEDDPDLITKKFWSHLKTKNTCHRIPETMHRNVTFRNKAIDKVELFNEYFCEQFSDPSLYDTDINWTNDSTLNEIDFAIPRIEKFLSCINSNKACGPDGIHGKILKNCSMSLAYPLSILFKLSYNSGLLPTDWKCANIVPVHKKGPKNDIENYRPISLTSLVMKTFERIIKEEIILKTSHMLDERQHGFLSQKSRTTNMLSFTDNVVMSLNDCDTMSVDVIYFDFSKAFDSVNHDLILRKLQEYYFINGRLLKFIRNYLCGRIQCVTLENCSSTTKSVLSGVPQGSILGPILFVLFMNDLPRGIDPGTNLALYADDTKIWKKIACDKDLELLQKDIDYLHNWSHDNKMNFHPKKCKVLSILHKPSPLCMLPFIAHYYTLGESTLDYTDCEKDLGVDISNNLSFNEHCNRIMSTAKQKLGLLRRTCCFVNDTKRRRVLYLTLVRSQFEHCSQIWHPNNVTLNEKFESIQKKCLKWVLFEEELSYSCKDVYLRICMQVKILPLAKRFIFNDIILFHKIFNNLMPVQMPDYLSLFSGITRLRSSHLDRLSYESTVLPRRNSSNALNRSFFYRTHMYWNSLPLEIREIRSHEIFKREVKNYLWKMAHDELIDNDIDISLTDGVT